MDKVDTLLVKEWQSLFTVYVEYEQIDDFMIWLKEHYDFEILDKINSLIEDRRNLAWARPDWRTKIDSFQESLEEFTIEINISFRLRTLRFEMLGWSVPNSELELSQAMDEIYTFEKGVLPLKDKWGINNPTCNIIVIDPIHLPETDFETWVTENIKLLTFLPINCHLKHSFTLSLHNFDEDNKKVPVMISNIRDEAGLLRKIVIICSKKETEDQDPTFFSHSRWVDFTGLTTHVIGRINNQASDIIKELSHTEHIVHSHFQDFPNQEQLLEKSERIVDISYRVSILQNKLDLLVDDYEGVQKNISILEDIVGLSDDLKELPSFGTSNMLYDPKSRIARHTSGAMFDVKTPERTKCKLNYECHKCERDSEIPNISPHGVGSIQEVMKQIDTAKFRINVNIDNIIRSIDRIKKFVSSITPLLSIRTNLFLDASLNKTINQQAQTLAKMEQISEESEKSRKTADKVSRRIEIVSLLFASFVVGEIASSFIIWWLQDIYGGNLPPNYTYFGGFSMALVIALGIFLSIYFYLKRKRAK